MLRETVISFIGWVENQLYILSKHMASMQNEAPSLDGGTFRLTSKDQPLWASLYNKPAKCASTRTERI